ncbi:MAG: TetR/AcrR family transcriptional regulator [Acidimicrobiales bacterium]
MTQRRRDQHKGQRAAVTSTERLERREALLDAAVAVIRRDGPGASMEAMATEAGITKPILYRHFGDRAGLVTAVAQRFAEALDTELDTALLSNKGPRDVLEQTIDAYLAFVERDPSLYRFVVRSATTGAAGADALGDFMDQVGRRVALVMGEQLRAAGHDSGGAEPIAHGIVGMVHAAGDWWVERQTMPRTRLVGYLTDLLWNGLAPLAAGAQAVEPPVGGIPDLDAHRRAR